MFNCIVEFVKNMHFIGFVIWLFIYDVVQFFILNFLGKSDAEDKGINDKNKYLKYIDVFKHNRRNLYQNFKFKLDCIMYSFIVIVHYLIGVFDSNDKLIFAIIFLLIYILLNRIIVLIITNLFKYIDRISFKFKQLLHKNLLNIIIFVVIILLFLFKGNLKPELKDGDLTISIFIALFVWGIVEYMSFRYNIIRNVIIERDELVNSLLKYIELHDETNNSNLRGEQYNDLLDAISSIGSKQKYYCLTKEYAEMFDVITDERDRNKVKDKIIEIHSRYTKEKVEFWYYHIIKEGMFYKNITYSEDKIVYYVFSRGSIIDIYEQKCK